MLLNLQIRNVKCFLALHTWGRARNAAQKPEKKASKKKKTRQTCKHFHGYSTQFAQRAWLLGNIQNGLYLHSTGGDGGECARRWEWGGKRILHAAYEIDMQMLYEARGFFSPRADLKFWLSLPLSFPPLFHWLRWWCTYCLLVNMIKIQISHYGKYMCVCVAMKCKMWQEITGRQLWKKNLEKWNIHSEKFAYFIDFVTVSFLRCANR